MTKINKKEKQVIRSSSLWHLAELVVAPSRQWKIHISVTEFPYPATVVVVGRIASKFGNPEELIWRGSVTNWVCALKEVTSSYNSIPSSNHETVRYEISLPELSKQKR